MSTTAFLPAKVVEIWKEADELTGLRVEAPESVSKSYTVPGQFVQLAVTGDRPVFLAIASPPGLTPLEFLVKASDATARLVSLPVGSEVEISLVQGRGYPVAGYKGHDLLLFAVGTGITPIRALLGYLAHHRKEFANITLFYGARSLATVPYRNEFTTWESQGIQTVRMLSRPEGPTEEFASGYVHEAVRVHPVSPGKTVAFVCGMPAMVMNVSTELNKLGIPAERIYQNF